MITVLPLTPQRWPDLEALFGARGCSVARGCWCMYYRVSGAIQREPGEGAAQASKRAMCELVDGGTVTGLIGYETDRTRSRQGEESVGSASFGKMQAGQTQAGQTPVGWVSLGPRSEYAKLRRSPVMRTVDDQPVWSIVCFVVPSEHRGRGVTKELLEGAITYAREQGAAILEAYPVDLAVPDHANAPWFGSAHMFAEAGFEEVARRRDDRPVMRLWLS
ncbi:MAG: GNAT family N-acetyltransferase [Trueperaceae bacterium]